MTTLTNEQREHLAGLLNERKPVLRAEIRSGLTRMRVDGYEELLSGTSDAGDESIASLLTDINNAAGSPLPTTSATHNAACSSSMLKAAM